MARAAVIGENAGTMSGSRRIQPDPRAQVEAHLRPGETVLWSGRPAPGRFARRGAAGAVAGGVLVGALGTIWATLSWRMLDGLPGIALAIFASIFVLVGLRLAATPLRRYRRAAATAYAVTDRRALIVGRCAPGGVLAITPDEFTPVTVQRHGDGTASVLFHETTTSSANAPGRLGGPATIVHRHTPDGFIGIADADQVALRLRKLRDKV